MSEHASIQRLEVKDDQLITYAVVERIRDVIQKITIDCKAIGGAPTFEFSSKGVLTVSFDHSKHD